MPRRTPNDDVSLETTAEGPIRQCAATRDRQPQTNMIRFVRAPDGEVLPDLGAKAPGRGVWVRAERGAIDQAVAKGGFGRGFKASAHAEADLADAVEAGLVVRLQQTLSLARKAGAVVTGFDQVRSALREREPGVLIQARDAAEDGRKKVYFLAKALYEQPTVSGALSSAELAMAFGRDGVIHAVLDSGAFSEKWLTDYRKLAGFRSLPEENWISGAQRDK